MKTLTLSIIILSSFLAYGQFEIDPELKKMQLYEGSTYVTYGHRITQLFSELEYKMEVGVYPKTNIAFLNYQQLIVLLQDTAKRQEWNQDKYLKSREYYNTNAKGGRLILYVERYDQFATNNKLFFVVIRDKSDEKIFEYQLPPRPAELVTTSVFSNWAYVDINIELPDEFYVYVNNKMSKYLSDTKFLLEQNAAPVVKQAGD